MPKPLIVFIGNEDHLGNISSHNRDALVYHLKNVHNCDIIVHEKRELSEEFVKNLQFFERRGDLRIILIIPGEENKKSRILRKKLRRRTSKKIPILLFFSIHSKDKLKRKYFFNDEGLNSILLNMIKGYLPKENFFDIQCRDDCNFLLSKLRHIYEFNFPDSIPPTNDIEVIEALRLRQLPAEIIKEEYDFSMRNPKSLIPISVDDSFQMDIDLVKIMSLEQRQAFVKRLRIDKIYGSYGDDVGIFLLDLVTMEYATASGWGNHILAFLNLKNRLEMIEQYRTGKRVSLDDGDIRLSFVARGFIFHDLPGFKNPVLKLELKENFQQWMGNIKNIARTLIRQKKYVPVDPEGYLIE